MNKRTLVLLVLTAAAACAVAQPAPDPPPGMPPAAWNDPGDGPPCDTACPPLRMGKERKMLEAVRISRMTEAVDLSEEQIAKFFPRLRKMEESLRAFDKQRDALVDELEKLLAGAPKDAELRARLDQIDKIEEQKQRRRLADRAELDALLSLPQRAKLRVFNQRFEDEVRSMVRVIRERRMKHLRP
jgi:septal ring factor EnvC (AmiA/AmiB activator)